VEAKAGALKALGRALAPEVAHYRETTAEPLQEAAAEALPLLTE
jgi:hypothetical protein